MFSSSVVFVRISLSLSEIHVPHQLINPDGFLKLEGQKYSADDL
jgi:hypothetical protein